MSGRGRPRSFDRTEVLRAAMRLFWERGYEGVSIADLLAAMKITAPSLYGAFGSKDELFREAVEFYLATDGDITARSLRADGPARRVIEQLLRSVADGLTRPGLPRGCLIAVGAANCTADNGEVAVYLKGQRSVNIEGIRQRLARAVDDGELPAATDIRALALFYGTVLHGMSIEARDGVTRKQLQAMIDIAMRNWPGDDVGGQPSRRRGAHGVVRGSGRSALQ